MIVEVHGGDEALLLSVVKSISGEHSKATPSSAVAWLLHRYADESMPERVIEAWSRIVEPVTRYSTPNANLDLLTHISGCDVKSLNRWEFIFRKLVALRGACESGSFSLSALVRPRGKQPPLLANLVDGRYDTWLHPKVGKHVTLDQVLDGEKVPGDWLRPPAERSKLVDDAWNAASRRYVSLMKKHSPHTARWAIRYLSHPESVCHGILMPLFIGANDDSSGGEK